jgi:hypothetical protein
VISPALEGSALADQWGRPELRAQLTDRIAETDRALAQLSPEESADATANELVNGLLGDLDQIARR